MINTSDYGAPLGQEDSELLVALAGYLSAESMHLLSNFKNNANAMLPPTGYVAHVRRDAPMKPDAFRGLHRLFRGVAIVDIDIGDSELSEKARETWRAAINLFLRDVSPHPPRLHDPVDGGWVCELGRGGWVGLFTGRIIQPNHSRTRNTSTYLVVTAGLPDKTAVELDAFLANQRSTWDDVFGPKMDPIRALAAENRNRILAVAVSALAMAIGMRSPVTYRAKPFPKQELRGDPGLLPAAKALLKELLKINTPLDVVPSWFAFPSVTPRDMPEIPAKLRGFSLGAYLGDAATRNPAILAGAIDCLCDDVVLIDSDRMAIIMGACFVDSENGVPVTHGPLSDVVIYNYKHAVEWLALPLCAIPYEACYHVGNAPIVKSSNSTWGDSSVEPNCNVAGEWSYKPPNNPETGEGMSMSRYGSPIDAGYTLEMSRIRGWTRVSVLDPLGGFSPRKTFAGLRSLSYPGVA
jgi:hypothetical protein